MNDEELKNKREVLSEADQKLGEVLKSLKRAEAPGDFDFRLKARLANTESRRLRRRTSWAYRYALPVMAPVLLFSAIAYNGGFLTSTNESSLANSATPEAKSPVPSDNQLAVITSTPAPAAPDAANSAVPVQPSPDIPKNELAAKNQKSAKPIKSPLDAKDNFNGSQDSTFRKAPVIEINSNANAATQKLENFVKPMPQSAVEVLSFIGLKTIFEGGKLKVLSVKPNSLAARSGVQADDIIESLNNQPLTPATVFTNKFEGNTVTVSRGGEKREIKLQNK